MDKIRSVGGADGSFGNLFTFSESPKKALSRHIKINIGHYTRLLRKKPICSSIGIATG